ncbi:MAG: LysR family transcriptional regulator [Deltaproteobacteria bacterium]|nr:LysR family transcriptional regulator [Deltaproteobacteria bacterium]
MRGELAGVEAFLAVAEKRSFTAAAAALRVTPSAVSQTVRALEERVGVRLLQRTTRSVGLTEAGARFLERVRPAMRAVHAAFETLDEERGRPAGTLKLNVPRVAKKAVLDPMLADFMAAYPELDLEIVVDDRLVDIVEGGFDAGIRIGETLDQEVVAVPISGPLRMAVVGAPAYFARRPRPKHPRDLLAHECVNYRRMSTGSIYDWEFEEEGHEISIAVEGRVVTNDQDAMIEAAIAGLGLAFVMESEVEAPLADGRLVRVLDRFCPRFPGYFLYHPSRTQVPAKLSALIETLRKRARRGGRTALR